MRFHVLYVSGLKRNLIRQLTFDDNMAKFIKIYSGDNCEELLLNKDLIESYHPQNGHCYVDIVIGRYEYSINSNDLVTTDDDCIPDFIKNVDLIKRKDLISGETYTLLDLTEE